MIAQFKIILPYIFVLPADSEFTIKPFEQGGHQIYFYPPVQAKAYIKPNVIIEGLQAMDDFGGMIEANNEPAISTSWMNGETPTIWANLLIVEFQKENFNRNADEKHPELIDPSVIFVFSVVNAFLERVRSLMKACTIRSLDIRHTPWRLQYLQDDRAPLPASTKGDSLKEFIWTGTRFSCNLMSSDLWNALQATPVDYKPPVWDILILDAEDLIHEPHAAVVLASAALEAFIADVLDRLALRSGVPNALWDWINNRGFFLKNPSFEEQFTKLLEFFSGNSLENYPELAKDISELRQARNSLVHTGKLEVRRTRGKGKKKKTTKVGLTGARVSELIASANKLIATVELLLRPEERRHKYVEKASYTLLSKVKQLPEGARGAYRINRVIPKKS